MLRAPARAVQFDRTRLRWPEWVVAASGLVLLIVLFAMNWYTLTLTSGGLGRKFLVPKAINGWNGVSHLRWLLLVTVLASLALFLLQATRRAPALPVTFSLFVTLLGGLSVVWLLVRVVIDPPAGRNAGGWIGLIAAAVLTWGAYRSLRMEGISPTDAPAHIPTVQLAPAGGAPAATAGDPAPSRDHS
jgi:hypothetical protein